MINQKVRWSLICFQLPLSTASAFWMLSAARSPFTHCLVRWTTWHFHPNSFPYSSLPSLHIPRPPATSTLTPLLNAILPSFHSTSSNRLSLLILSITLSSLSSHLATSSLENLSLPVTPTTHLNIFWSQPKNTSATFFLKAPKTVVSFTVAGILINFTINVIM